jgi:protease-4
MTAEEEALLKESLQEVYMKMLVDISSARSTLSLDQLKELADGRIFTGERAKEVGLVDSLGGMEEAIKVIMEKANLKERPYVLDHPKMTWETFFEMFSYYFNEHILPKALFKGNVSEYLNTLTVR